jgi:hypothetical protein
MSLLLVFLFCIAAIAIFAALIISVVALPVFIVVAVIGLIFSIFGLVFRFIFGGPLLLIIIVAFIIYLIRR